MPSYKVIDTAFFNGQLVGGNTGRNVIHVDKEFDKCPAWAVLIADKSIEELDAIKTVELEERKTRRKKVSEAKAEVGEVDFLAAVESKIVESL